MKKFLSKGGETGETCRAFDEVVLQVDQVTEPWQRRLQLGKDVDDKG
jgi:hypothetical protein